jgi:hypothetical protein
MRLLLSILFLAGTFGFVLAPELAAERSNSTLRTVGRNQHERLFVIWHREDRGHVA